MDIGEDFITAEFLNILFFQQKNVVIFPYVDLKHLHALEIFTIGHTVVDLESTALHDLKNILEFEASNSYSQNPTLYFIYNLDTPRVKQIIALDSIRCVLNTNEKIIDLANGSNFVFYNKKSGNFINYPESDLEFEKSLIASATSPAMLQDSIQTIKSTATKIFEQMNLNPSPEKLTPLLKEYDIPHWQKILDFTSRYYNIQLPPSSELIKHATDTSFEKPREKNLHDYTDEYELIVSKNRAIGKEFVQLIHEYRSKRVNSSHLDLEELFSPLKLYNYLRNRHWKDGIPESFIRDWSEMKLSSYELTEDDIVDFEDICSKLGVFNINLSPVPEPMKVCTKPSLSDEILISEKPSLHDNWQEYKQWLTDRMDSVSRLVDKAIKTQIFSQNKVLHTHLLKELSRLSESLGRVKLPQSPQTSKLGEEIKEEITTRLNQVRIENWIRLFAIEDKVRLLITFRRYQERLYKDTYGMRISNGGMVEAIREMAIHFGFPPKLGRDLEWLNRFRNRITHDEKFSDAEVGLIIGPNIIRINDIIMKFIVSLINFQLSSLLRDNTHLYDGLHTYIRDTYFNAEYISIRKSKKE